MNGGTDHISVLHAHGGKRLAKSFRTATNGVVTKSDYDSATWYRAESAPVASIRDVHALLLRLESDPYSCVIRGEPTANCNRGRTRRRKAGANAPFAEVPRHWPSCVPLRTARLRGMPGRRERKIAVLRQSGHALLRARRRLARDRRHRRLSCATRQP